MLEYTMVWGDHMADFLDDMNELAKKGWRPHKGFVVADSRFYQLMVREAPKFKVELAGNEPDPHETFGDRVTGFASGPKTDSAAEWRPATDQEIVAAREQYGSDDVEVDHNALASDADHGTWVQAWVWVPKE